VAEERKTYSEKLKDPRWQKKRLEILQRDGWACRRCGDKETTLHVHHRRYLPKRDPWDYDPEYLATLCEVCHESEYEERQCAEHDLIEALKMFDFWAEDVHDLATMFIRLIGNPAAASRLVWYLSFPPFVQHLIDIQPKVHGGQQFVMNINPLYFDPTPEA
jgi:hypothetical protein